MLIFYVLVYPSTPFLHFPQTWKISEAVKFVHYFTVLKYHLSYLNVEFEALKRLQTLNESLSACGDHL